MPCAVVGHIAFHSIEELLFVVGQLHVYEVNNNYASQIAQAHLAHYFSCSFQIGSQRILFLSSLRATRTAVYVNYMQGFGMLNNQVCTAIQVYRFAKR